jgi:hypothetical protein
MNTRFTLLYRNGNNDKSTKQVVLSGEISPEQVHRIGEMLDEGHHFIAAEVGFPSPIDNHAGFASFPNPEHDHSFTSLVQFEEGTPSVSDFLTDEKATDTRTIEEVVVAFENQAFDIDAEEDRYWALKVWNKETIDYHAESMGIEVDEDTANLVLSEIMSYDRITHDEIQELIREYHPDESSRMTP